MSDILSILLVMIILAFLLGSLTQWIVRKLNPPKPDQPAPDSIFKSVSKAAPIAFLVTLVINIILISSSGPIGYLLIASGPAMIVLAAMSLLRFVSVARDKVEIVDPAKPQVTKPVAAQPFVTAKPMPVVPQPKFRRTRQVISIFLKSVIALVGVLLLLFVYFYVLKPNYQIRQMSKKPDAQLLFRIERDVKPPKAKLRQVNYDGPKSSIVDLSPPKIIVPTNIYYEYTTVQPLQDFRKSIDTKHWKLIEDSKADKLSGAEYTYINTTDYNQPVCLVGSYPDSNGAFKPSITIKLHDDSFGCSDSGIVLGTYDKNQKLFDFDQLPLGVTAQVYSLNDATKAGEQTEYNSFYGLTRDKLYFTLSQVKHTKTSAVPDVCKTLTVTDPDTDGSCQAAGKLATGQEVYLEHPYTPTSYPTYVANIEGTDLSLTDRSQDPVLASGNKVSTSVNLLTDVLDKRIPITPEKFHQLANQD